LHHDVLEREKILEIIAEKSGMHVKHKTNSARPSFTAVLKNFGVALP